ncbi:magnesium chelatase subunit D, putative chloroplast precursor [Tribonema minus]|uniref:Mg-protoporphyrin IX chelatase n=1 Tax=Tribonema minus TaxID=303371 RepID=A0A836CJK3_9STRA|nr:magnesium chelatase subunit D, putative chloroplast precursor [Tribonema minus]
MPSSRRRGAGGLCLLAAALAVLRSADAFTSVPAASLGAAKPKLATMGARRSSSRLSMSSGVDDRVKAAMEYEALLQASEEPRPRALMANIKDVGRPFPMSMIIGNDNIKTALLLAAVNPAMGGVVISGRRGTAKSVLARALHRLLPPIERVKGSNYNLDPEIPDQVDSFTAEMLAAEGKELGELEREIVEAPFVQVPLNVMEDRLLGSVDVEESVRMGKTVFMPGLLAKAHRGILYVDDINLLDTELANILLGVVSDGWVNVQREGMSVRFPCRPLLIATFNPEEADLRDHLLDRIAVSLSADASPLDMGQRLEAVNGVLDWASISPETLKALEEQEDNVKTRIIFARQYLKEEVKLSRDQLKYLCEEASRAGCQGHRAEIFAAEVARASAALEDRRVTSNDLKLAVKLAIAPRGTFFQQMEEEMMAPPPPPPPPPQPQNNPDNQEPEMEDAQDEDAEEQEDKEDQEPPEPEDQPDEDEAPSVPQEFMFGIDSTPLDPELLDFSGKSGGGKSGGRGLIFSQERGRYIKPMLPRGKVMRLAVDATMRAAAPYQRPRRERALASGDERQMKRKVFIETGDVRTKRMARKAGSLIIFCVDASGSMALNRMNAAKGAAMSLLQEAYQSRDKICLIPFQGERAEVLLPPTKSIAMAKSRLETMPCGGGSPLAHAINMAVRTGLNEQKSGDVGKVIVVMVSDGRANVPLSVSNGSASPDDPKPTRDELKEEVLNTAKGLRALKGFNLVVLDTENKFVSTGLAKEIAAAAGGKYHYIPKATDKAMAKVANDAIASMKSM